LNPIDAYAHDVVDGRLPAGKYHQLACARHLRDREREGTPEFPYRFDFARAERFARFVSHLRHYKGEWAGKPVTLEPWQFFMLGSLFAWVHVETELRRFRYTYFEIPRKNGKSTIAATAALYLTFFDGEAGAEGYTVATKREQARIVFGDAKKMVESSGLKSRVKVRVSNLHRTDTACKLEPLGADADSTDGLNPHLVVIDEWHAYKNRELIDVLETATGARRQPVIFGITTAGSDPVSPCGDQHDYACKVLDGVLHDDAFLAFIAHADEDDDPFDERTWQKANPNWGVSVKPEDMRALAQKAMNMPAAAGQFKQKRLNLWVNAETPWLAMDGWKRAQTTWTPEDMRGEPCWVGIDFSSKLDLTAVGFAFPPNGERKTWRFILKCFTPEDTLRERARRDRAPYDVWVEQGWLETTPGNRIDQQAVRDALLWGKELFDLHEAGYDPWNAGNLHVDLQNDGFAETQVIEVPQTFAHMSGPSKDFEADVLDGLVDVGGNPLFTWMAANAVVQRDGKDNIQPIKKKSRGRIDGIVAGIIARKLAATSELEEKPWTGQVRSLAEFL
jgi:phage terminase large subunit-like protein